MNGSHGFRRVDWFCLETRLIPIMCVITASRAFKAVLLKLLTSPTAGSEAGPAGRHEFLIVLSYKLLGLLNAFQLI